MTRIVLDTSAVIGPRPEFPRGAEISVSAVTVAELHYGVLVARDDAVKAERLRRLTLLERTVDALPVDAVIAHRYGVLAATVARGGRSPRPRSLDLLVAATASAHGAELWTRDGDDLAGLDDLVTVVVLS